MTYQQQPNGQYAPGTTQPNTAQGFWRSHLQTTYVDQLKEIDPKMAQMAEAFLNLPPAEQRKVVRQGMKLASTASTGNVAGTAMQYAKNAGIGV